MNARAAGIVAAIRTLEAELDAELARDQLKLSYTVSRGKVEFEEHVLKFHKQMRRQWLRYVLDARPAVVLSAPVIYATFLPFALLDLFVSVYQQLCFGVYGIARVHRSDHLVFDRSQLAYLNGLERFNCRFCSYANGVISYAREIAARTEQYWCPIKHSRRVLGVHGRYHTFADYGDAAAYGQELADLRGNCRQKKPDGGCDTAPTGRSRARTMCVMETIEQRQRGYLDVLVLMNERTGIVIDALVRTAKPWRVYEGAGTKKEVTQTLLQELRRQQADLDYLIKADKQT